MSKQETGSSEIREVSRVRVDELNRWKGLAWKKNLCRSAKNRQEVTSRRGFAFQRRRAATELDRMTSLRGVVSSPPTGSLI